MSARLGAGPLLVLSLAFAAGCASGAPESPPAVRAPAAEWVFEVRASAAPARLPADADDLTVLNTVASVITRDLKLPLPEAVRAVAYADEARYAEGLARRGVSLEQARQEVQGTAALAVGTSILLRSDLLAKASIAARVGLYAHELAHVAQGRLIGRRGVALWIWEGHADWVEHRVVELLGHRSYAEARDETRRRVARASPPREQFPSLGDIETAEAWKDAARRLGWAPTYGQAFLAVDWLVERQTEGRLREFLREPERLLPEGIAGERFRWGGVFTLTYDRFLADFRAYLLALP